MLYSLLNVNSKCIIYVAAMDEDCYWFLKKTAIERVIVINIKEVETNYPLLKKTKNQRTKPEYYFTSKGYICHFITQKEKKIDSITYLDSDLYFFSDPQPIFDDLIDASIGITKHNFHWLNAYQLKYGKFNAGWITFKTKPEGLKCLEEWMINCSNWCYSYLDDDKYGDQKYLDLWPKKYKNVKVIKAKGANLAPWNIKNYSIQIKEDKIYVDNELLIFYHFSKLNRVNHNQYKTNLNRGFVSADGLIKDKIYKPYIKELIKYQSPFENKSLNLNNHKTFKTRLYDFEKKIRDYLFVDTIKID